MKFWFKTKIFSVLLSVFLITQFVGIAAVTEATDVSVILLEIPSAILVTPDTATINMGETQQFQAIAVYDDASTMVVTNDPLTTWDSADDLIASVNSTGLVDSVMPGSVSINATYGGLTGSAELTINPPDSITVSPSVANINPGQTMQFTATAVFPDESTRVLNADSNLSWNSSVPVVASVNSSGLASAQSAGTTNIIANYFGVSGQGVLNVISTTLPPDGGGGSGGGGSGGGLPPGEEPPGEEPPGEEPPGEEPLGEEPPGEEPPGEEPPGEEPPGEEPPGEEPPGEEPPGEEPPGEEPPVVEPPVVVSEPELPGPPAPGEEEYSLPEEEELSEYAVPATEEEHQVLETVFLPDELSVTRGEVMEYMHDKFNFPELYNEYLTRCYNDLDECFSIFLQVTNYDEVMIDPDYCERDARGNCLQSTPPFDIHDSKLYPDLPPDSPHYYYEVNLGTMLAVVQGYYEEDQSPFRPYRIISRIEALKVILGSVDMIDWIYYPELEALLGGIEGVTTQTAVFNDVVPSRQYMWWYPRYINLACKVDMIDCESGTNFRPDDFITEAELKEMLKRLRTFMNKTDHIESLKTDDDNDSLTNYDELNATYTDPYNEDTDNDKLLDGAEVFTYQTNPFLTDSDWEGLTDYEEVMIYKTDPLDQDTDDDTFSDYVEITVGTDPNDAASIPGDLNGNDIADEWEKRYGIEVSSGVQDSDGDGLSDVLEYKYGTDPINVDTDGDGFSDADEVLTYRTNPLDSNDPGELKSLKVQITNFRQNQLISDSTPLVKGVGPTGAEIRIVLRNDFGHERVIGSTVADQNYAWLFEVQDPIRDGRYQIVARALEPSLKRVTESYPVHIKVDTTLNVTEPKPEKLADEDIGEEVLLNNLKVKIRDNKPVLYGETEFGNEVTATWRSVVLTSALIADSLTGEFEIESPEVLELGDHVVYVTATRLTDEAQSETIKVNFNVGVPDLSAVLRGVDKESVAAEGGVFRSVFATVSQNWGLWLIILFVLIVLTAAGIYFFLVWKRNNQDKKDEKAVKPKEEKPSKPKSMI